MDFTDNELKIICHALVDYENKIRNIAYKFKDDDYVRNYFIDWAIEISDLNEKISMLKEE